MVAPAPPPVTNPTLDVLSVLLMAREEDIQLHGWLIMKETKRSGSTVYGVLDRLEDLGWIAGYWEERNTERIKPRRRFYRLTPTGATEATALISEHRPQALHRRMRRAPHLHAPEWLRPHLPGSA
jgi:PadR family transcriptional regulator, regulatory protein PadR